MSQTDATVLVVDDEREIADLYARWLEDDYDVVVAYTGGAALEALDDTVDVVLLDRRIPDLHGDEVLERIRERELDCWVAMVTAVEPEFDILDMGFDDYLVKPVTGDGLRDTVATLVARGAYDSALREHFAAVSKWAVLSAQHAPEELADSPEFRSLQTEIDGQRAELDELMGELTDADFRAVLRDAIDQTDGGFEDR
ncbi:MAG: HalX domain-containing protein [Halobacteriales archaeon]|nr:HalX domain-containing protein [Halobacteriales archaeon]